MTREQLEDLAEYRKHKHCRCCHCQAARGILMEMDAKRALGTQADDGRSQPAANDRP